MVKTTRIFWRKQVYAWPTEDGEEGYSPVDTEHSAISDKVEMF